MKKKNRTHFSKLKRCNSSNHQQGAVLCHHGTVAATGVIILGETDIIVTHALFKAHNAAVNPLPKPISGRGCQSDRWTIGTSLFGCVTLHANPDWMRPCQLIGLELTSVNGVTHKTQTQEGLQHAHSFRLNKLQKKKNKDKCLFGEVVCLTKE